MIQFVLMDIEGTTSSIDFVHKVLFPYSLDRLQSYLHEHENDQAVKKAVSEFKKNLPTGPEELTLSEVAQMAQSMIKDDVKYGPLKTIQGLIWEEGYKSGKLKGHVYPEVPGCFKKWTSQGLKLGIYSSGSVLAQKLIFGFTDYGDLTPYLSAYFDTAVGGKKERPSYDKIATELKIAQENILFLSDRSEELEAAKSAGYKVVFVQRQALESSTPFKQIEHFKQLNFESPFAAGI